VVVFVLDLLFNNMASMWIRFYPELILRGQVWRLVTFVFAPVSTGGSILLTKVLFFALNTFFYYWIGTALERQWGTTRFSVFYLLGVVLNVVAGLLIYAFMPITANLLGGYYFETATMHYVNLSMFFSFATLYPDMQVMLYGIIPIKIKWLAWLDVALFAYDIIVSLVIRQWVTALMPIVAILNYFIFFWDDLTGTFRRGRDRVRRHTDPNVINFKKAQRQVQQNQQRGYLHKCAVCGVTDADDPNMEFRYCTKCNGYYCYCMNHINNHVHVQ
jgi:hypothetical protein